MTNALTQTAVENLLRYYERTCSSDPLPYVNPKDEERTERLIIAVALAGDYTPFGYAHGTLAAVDNLCSTMGVEHVEELLAFESSELERGLWVSCPQIPDHPTNVAVRVLREALGGLRNWWGFSPEPLSALQHRDADFIRDTLVDVTGDAVIPMLYVAQVLGVHKVRPNPSGGSAAVLARVGLTDWTQYLTGGTRELRRDARAVFESSPFELQVACELWMLRCPDWCPYCPCRECCEMLSAGLL